MRRFNLWRYKMRKPLMWDDDDEDVFEDESDEEGEDDEL